MDPPFPVCSFCPNCLFPVRDHNRMLEEQRLLAIQEANQDDSYNGGEPTPGGTANLEPKVFNHFEI